MHLRCFFDCGAGVCLWAADDDARGQFGYAVELAALPLAAETVAAGESLMAEHDAFVNATLGGQPPGEEAVSAWFRRARLWLEQLRRDLGTTVTIEDALAPPEAAPAADESPVIEGRVIGCFASPAAAEAARRRLRANHQWEDSVDFNLAAQPHWLPGLPEQILAALSPESGFIVGWHQAADGGPSCFLAGDPLEHAIACARTRNVTGLVNFLRELRCCRVLVGDDWVTAPWQPSPRHRREDSPGAAAWDGFVTAAQQALAGRPANPDFLARERDRLLYTWELPWPATLAEALIQAGFTRHGFNDFGRPA
jgi:hypothetical protein